MKNPKEERIQLVELPSAPPHIIVVVAPRAVREAAPPVYHTVPYYWSIAPISGAQGRAECSTEVEKGGLDFSSMLLMKPFLISRNDGILILLHSYFRYLSAFLFRACLPFPFLYLLNFFSKLCASA